MAPKQNAPLLPRDPRDARLKLERLSTVVRMTQTDRVSAWGALSVCNSQFLFSYLHSFVHTSLQWDTARRACYAHVTYT